MAHAMIKSILVPEVVRMIAEKFQLPEEEAMDQFYTSGTAEALSDDETGLYGQSALFIFGLFCQENPERLSNYFAFGWKGNRMVYFTSDLHFGHSGIITMQNRPFSDTAEMNRTLLCNYNALIHKDDTVYILGDICHHFSLEEANNIIGKMNGKKILIRGNHDKKYDEKLFDEICDFKTVSLNGKYFALMHYPMLSWPKKNSGSIQLHGHIHADMEYNRKNKEEGVLRYDVGVDANQFCPVSVKQIIKFFEE